MALQHLIERTTTVAELTDLLKQYPSDMPVMFGYTSGDYWRTEVAEPIEQIHTQEVAFSDYHGKAKIVEYNYESDSDEEEEEEAVSTVQVLLLK
jgi:hypothetical protein